MYAVTLPNVQHVQLSGGDRGIWETCALMRREINRTKHSPDITSLARSLVVGRQTKTEQSQAITEWVAGNIAYREDVDMSWTEKGLQWVNQGDCPRQYHQCEAVEMLYQPEQVLRQRYGDCDDFCMLLGALHEAVGIPVRFVVVALNAANPREFSHVYLKVQLEGGWVPVDGIHKEQPWGWEAPRAFRRATC